MIGGLAFDSNNRIVVDAQINTGPIVMCLLPTGSSDYFGDNGNGAKLPFNNFGKPIVRPDDSILIPAIDGDGFTGNPSMTALTSTGQIDTSFGTNGIAKLVHSTNFAAGLYGTLQPDGKIDLATTGPVGGDDGIVIARFDSQGKLDSSFGSNGAATVSFANSVQVHSIIYTNSEPRITVVANSVGNIVLAAFDALTPVAPPPSGTISGTVFNDANGNNQRDGNEAGLAGRTVFVDANQNHTLDPGETSAVTDSTGHYSFGVLVGQYTVRDTQPAGWKSPLIVPQQVIVTQAQTTVVNLASSKTDTAMPLDTTFGTAGVVRVSQLGGEGGIMRQSDGKLLVIGSNTVGRFTAAGALDKTFGVNGWASNPFTNADVDSLALQSDGKIVVAGTRPLTPTSSSYGIVLGRLNSDGSPDKTYGTNGIVTTSLANVAAGVRVALRQDNSAIVTVFSFAPTPGFNLVLVKPTGQIDSTFGTGGYVVLNIDKTTIQTVCRLRPMQFFWLELWLTD